MRERSSGSRICFEAPGEKQKQLTKSQATRTKKLFLSCQKKAISTRAIGFLSAVFVAFAQRAEEASSTMHRGTWRRSTGVICAWESLLLPLIWGAMSQSALCCAFLRMPKKAQLMNYSLLYPLIAFLFPFRFRPQACGRGHLVCAFEHGFLEASFGCCANDTATSEKIIWEYQREV